MGARILGIAAVAIIGIYIAAVLQRGGQLVAQEQVLWIVGSAILGATVGLLLFDP